MKNDKYLVERHIKLIEEHKGALLEIKRLRSELKSLRADSAKHDSVPRSIPSLSSIAPRLLAVFLSVFLVIGPDSWYDIVSEDISRSKLKRKLIQFYPERLRDEWIDEVLQHCLLEKSDTVTRAMWCRLGDLLNKFNTTLIRSERHELLKLAE
jgi:hypothetical protein